MKIRSYMDKTLGYFLALLMGAMSLDVLWGVFTRYILDHQSPWSEEVARFLLIWIGILGAAYAAGQKLHLAINLLPSKLTGRSLYWLNTVIDILIAAFATGVLIVGGIRYVYVTLKLGQTSSALQLPMWIIYLVVPISGLVILLYILLDHLNKKRS